MLEPSNEQEMDWLNVYWSCHVDEHLNRLCLVLLVAQNDLSFKKLCRNAFILHSLEVKPPFQTIFFINFCIP